MNIYSINLNAGDIVTGSLSWAVTADLDLYLHSQGQDLLIGPNLQSATSSYSNP
jgi:hypothetical protein